MDDAPPSAPSSLSRPATGAVVGLVIGLLWKDLGLRALVSYWGTAAPIVLGSMIVCSLLWLTRVRRWLVVLTMLLALLWVVVAFTPLCPLLVPGLVRREAPRKADAIFVLSSNVQPDDEPSISALSRGTRALELLGSGYATKLLVSELAAPAGSYRTYLMESARKLGVPHATEIESIGLVGNTHDEAQRVADLFRARGWKTLLLVTSPTHSRRAATTFEHAGIPNVVSVPSIETYYDLERLAYTDERIDVFPALAHEWLGLAVYRLRGWR
jgi:uncharacterized SAM-binding protein YcdF (DUF218 family)